MALRSFVYISVLAIIMTASASPVDNKQPELDCKSDEVYRKCSLAYCYQTCSDLFKPPPCPSLAANCYVPDCLCNEGFLRNSEGVCVSETQCYAERRLSNSIVRTIQ